MQQFITQYGYLAVFVLMLAESACIPVPSEVIMLLGGALAGGAVAGAHPSLAGIIIAGVLGNVAGSYVAWAVGRYACQAAVRRWGRLVGIREREIDRSAAWFQRHGNAAVLVGRVIPVVRTFISLPGGLRRHGADPVRRVHDARLHPLDGGPGRGRLRPGCQLAECRQRLPRPHLCDRGNPGGRRGSRDHRALPPRQARPRRHSGNPRRWREGCRAAPVTSRQSAEKAETCRSGAGRDGPTLGMRTLAGIAENDEKESHH